MAEAGVPWHLVDVCSVGGVCMWGGGGGYYSPPPVPNNDQRVVLGQCFQVQKGHATSGRMFGWMFGLAAGKRVYKMRVYEMVRQSI